MNNKILDEVGNILNDANLIMFNQPWCYKKDILNLRPWDAKCYYWAQLWVVDGKSRLTVFNELDEVYELYEDETDGDLILKDCRRGIEDYLEDLEIDNESLLLDACIGLKKVWPDVEAYLAPFTSGWP